MVEGCDWCSYFNLGTSPVVLNSIGMDLIFEGAGWLFCPFDEAITTWLCWHFVVKFHINAVVNLCMFGCVSS